MVFRAKHPNRFQQSAELTTGEPKNSCKQVEQIELSAECPIIGGLIRLYNVVHTST